MKQFFLFPHVYNRRTILGHLFRDTLSNKTVILRDIDSQKLSENEKFPIVVNDINSSVLELLISNNFGYIVDCAVTPVSLQGIHFTTSRDKLATSSVYKDSKNAINLIKKISIFIDNVTISVNNHLLASALDFPFDSSLDFNETLTFLNSIIFPNLEEIEIVSSLTNNSQAIIEKLRDYGLPIIFRIVADTDHAVNAVIESANSNPTILYKIFISAELSEFHNFSFPENVIPYHWTTNLKTIIEYPDTRIIPVIYDITKQSQLFENALFDEDDVKAINRNMNGLEFNSMFNSNFMGNISIKGDGVFVGPVKISNLLTFEKEFVKWYYSSDNLWFYVRRMKSKCNTCFFADLCPPISIIEILGIINYPCRL